MGLRNPFRCRLSVWAAAWLLCACVASHDVEADGQGLGSGGAGGSSNAGAGGSKSSGGSDSTGSGDCVAADCPGVSLFGAMAAGCCTADGKCGADVSGLGLGDGCAEMNAPGDPDSACPSQSLGGFFTLEGCCRPDGQCGVLDTFAGLGCTTVGATGTTSCEP